MLSRQTAYKLWIANILNSQFHNGQEEFDPDYIIFNNNNISRVNIIGNVIDTFSNEDNSYSTIILDDNSATIRIKSFGKETDILNNIKKGDIVLVVGRLKEYQNETYIVPDFVKILEDPNWDLLRKIELMKSIGKIIKQVIKNEIISPVRNNIYKIIKERGDNGINIEEIKQMINIDDQEVESILNKLIEDGEIYQDKPNNYRAI